MAKQAFVLTLPARAEFLSVVRHVLGGVVDGWKLGPGDLDDVQIAVTEACANVVTHAYREVPAGTMEVQGGLENERVVVTVRDHGPGILPHAESGGLGMGIALIGALTERLEFGKTDNGTHEVRMVFARTAGG
jgi:serine/threonine-protein kinase RsbW